MRAVMTEIPPGFLEARCKLGADRWDEQWEGDRMQRPDGEGWFLVSGLELELKEEEGHLLLRRYGHPEITGRV